MKMNLLFYYRILLLMFFIVSCVHGKKKDISNILPKNTPATILDNVDFVWLLNNVNKIHPIRLDEDLVQPKIHSKVLEAEVLKSLDPLNSFKDFFVDNEWILGVTRSNTFELYNTITKKQSVLDIPTGSGPFEIANMSGFHVSIDGFYLIDGGNMKVQIVTFDSEKKRVESTVKLRGRDDDYIRSTSGFGFVHQLFIEQERWMYSSASLNEKDVHNSKKLFKVPSFSHNYLMKTSNEQLLAFQTASTVLILYNLKDNKYDLLSMHGDLFDHLYADITTKEQSSSNKLNQKILFDASILKNGDVLLKFGNLNNKKAPYLILTNVAGSYQVKKLIYPIDTQIKQAFKQKLGLNFLAGLHFSDGVINIAYIPE